MKKKRLIVAVIVLILCIGAYAGVRSLHLDEEAQEQEETVYMYQTDTDGITAFSFVSGGETLSFTKTDGTWSYDGDSSFAADQTTLSSMASALAQIEAEQALEEPEALSEYGLDAPSNTITVSTADGTDTLYIGNENEAAGGYYAKLEGGDTVYLIGTSLPSRFDCTLDSLEETEEETSSQETSSEAESSGETETSGEESSGGS